MFTTQIAEGQDPYVVEATVTFCGNDVAVNIGGGLIQHIGAVALAAPRPSMKRDGNISATASVICILGHKDDMLARTAALHLASEFNRIVLVSVGLHADNATGEDIECLNKNFAILLTNIEIYLRNNIY